MYARTLEDIGFGLMAIPNPVAMGAGLLSLGVGGIMSIFEGKADTAYDKAMSAYNNTMNKINTVDTDNMERQNYGSGLNSALTGQNVNYQYIPQPKQPESSQFHKHWWQ